MLDVGEESAVEVTAFGLEDVSVDLDAGMEEFVEAATGDEWVRVVVAADDSFDFFVNNKVGTGRGFALMGAGFEVDVECGVEGLAVG